MSNEINEKALVTIDNNNIFRKIINFFKCKIVKEKIPVSSNNSKEIKDTKLNFKEYIKVIEDDAVKLLNLQKEYRSGKIREEDLSQEQILSLCDLYDKQITILRKSNELRKQNLLQYRKNITKKI